MTEKSDGMYCELLKSGMIAALEKLLHDDNAAVRAAAAQALKKLRPSADPVDE